MKLKQAGAELGQAQLKLEQELGCSSIQGSIPFKVVFHKRLSSIEGQLP